MGAIRRGTPRDGDHSTRIGIDQHQRRIPRHELPNFGQKKPRVGSGVIRVIVVVACSVSTSAARLCWIMIIIISALSASNYDYCSSYLASSGFDVCLQMSNTATACKNLFLCAWFNSKTRAIR
jgi:hypothetical protein